ncbi:MAG: phospholipase D-like domain-containing protein [Armatimonadota bacterium]|nr:phospholipase D-like domain-containing protein [Armatimonadota bacterium]
MSGQPVRIAVLATGRFLLRSGVRAIEPVLLETIGAAREELHLAVYSMDDAAGRVLEAVRRAALRGVRCTVIVGNPGHRQGPFEGLLSLAEQVPHLRVVAFQDPDGGVLHAKVAVVDRRVAIVGSANLTRGGLAGNHEIALLVEGEPAWQVAELLDGLTAGAGK